MASVWLHVVVSMMLMVWCLVCIPGVTRECAQGGHVSEKVRVTEYGMFSMTAKFSVVPGKLSMRAC